MNLIKEAERKNVFKLPYRLKTNFDPKPLPNNHTGIKYSFVVDQSEKHLAFKDGWAFLEGEAAYNKRVYVIFEADSCRYIFRTTRLKRPAIAKKYGPNYLQSGFQFKVAKRKLKEGRYQVGLLISQRSRLIGNTITNNHVEILNDRKKTQTNYAQ